MRRSAAILLIGLFSFSLMAPIVVAEATEARLPECCRRAGNHHCSIGAPAGRSVAANCPLYAGDHVTPAPAGAAYVKPALAMGGPVPARSMAPVNRPASYSYSGSYCPQLRGPPRFLS